MHDIHKRHERAHAHEDDSGGDREDLLKRLHLVLGHWIEHEDSHAESYREWAGKASSGGEEEIAREIHLAIEAAEAVKGHLKRAKAISAAKLVLRK